ncbi:MFS transporter [Nostoc flagelliforme FACHB-838]|uniref:MFS transporter n=1 Tax=Nostoc flagelliforme FACHB-838 TaxID=2692904 RepID=A0ABR8E5P8_9NOSO|nr:MFS transporter [Nostoc flagelliforme]MBD2535933.1 MFS transporter [Nostoc flagelliforme FACHB-838]
MNKNFVIFLLAYAISNFGNWLTFAAVSYLTFQNGGTTTVAILQIMPILTLSIFGSGIGLLVDYKPAKKTILFTMFFLGVQTLFYLFYQWQLYMFLMSIQAIFHFTFMAAYNRFFPALVEDSYLDKACGIVNLISQIAVTIGLTSGTYLTNIIGTKVFLIDVATFVIAIAAISTIPVEVKGILKKESINFTQTEKKYNFISDILEGIKYIINNEEYKTIVIFYTLAHVCWGLKDVIALAIVEKQLKLPLEWTGLYMATSTIAEIFASILIAHGLINSTSNSIQKIESGICLLSLSFVGTSLSSSPLIGFSFKFSEGFASAITGVICHNILLLRSPQNLRGRLSGIIGMLTNLSLLGGKLLAGIFSDLFTPQAVCGWVGGAVFIVTIIFIRKNLNKV